MSTHTNEEFRNVVPFDPSRARAQRSTSSKPEGERAVVAVVTVTRFIGGERVHAQVPVFADEIYRDDASRAELKHEIPELAELLADAAVEGGAYLDRLAAAFNARPVADFYARR
jgi:hypothetical protein